MLAVLVLEPDSHLCSGNTLSFIGTKTILKISALGLAVALAACSNTGKKKVSLVPSKDVGTQSSGRLFTKLQKSNEIVNTGSAGQNLAALPVTSDNTKFSSKSYGVKGSPRVSTQKRVRKGGGRYQVGKPYTIRGKRYVPREDPNYKTVGLASWYGPNFHGRLTANGEIYDQYSLSAAHPTMPLPSYAKVTNLENGASVTVRVNDRGPFAHNRVIDLSSRAAELLDYTKKGIAKVKVEYVGRARMDGLDENRLVASYDPGRLDPRSIPANSARQVLLAQASEPRRANTARKALATINTNDKPPVPTLRPSVALGGVPIVLSEIVSPRPTSLVNGYVSQPEHKSSALEALEELSLPVAGMNGLERITIGPIPVDKTEEVSDRLTEFGPVLEISEQDAGLPHLVVTYDQADKDRIADYLATQSLSISKPD